MERVAIRILLEPERLVEKRRRRRASLDRAEVLAAHEPQSPIALGLVIENLWSSRIDDSIDPGRIHEHDSQPGRSCIFFKASLLKPDPSVRLQTIGVMEDTALLGEPVPFMLCCCLLPWPTSAVVGVVIVSSSLDGHNGLPWTAGGKVKNLDFTTEGGCATLAL